MSWFSLVWLWGCCNLVLMEGLYVINLPNFLFFVINESIRLRLDFQIILFRRHLKIKPPVMVINFSGISRCSFVISLRHFACLEMGLSINLYSAWYFPLSLSNCPSICANFGARCVYNAFFINMVLAAVLCNFIVNQYNLL